MKGKGIYYILNLVNGYLYIGSAKCMHRRCGNHKSTAINGKHRNPKLQAAFNKYGLDNFEFGVVAYTFNVKTEQELQDIEQKWIDFYKPEYNVLKKAHRSAYVAEKKERPNRRGFRHTDETKIKMSEKSKGHTRCRGLKWKPDRKVGKRTGGHPAGINHPSYGKKHTKEHIDKRLESFEINKREKLKLATPILQYDLNGFFIKEWLHEEQASKELNIRIDLIRRVLNRVEHSKTAGGFIFVYKKENSELTVNEIISDIKTKKHNILLGNKKSSILQYDLDGNFIKEWNSMSEIQRELKIPRINISNCCKGNRLEAGGYTWKRKEGDFEYHTETRKEINKKNKINK